MAYIDTVERTIASAPSRAAIRFDALDSWRGVCALLVAAFHFPLAGPISQNALVRGSFLFVDFFFVLSGFVFAHAYGARLTRGEGLGGFLINRIGRLAPLHLFMLSVLVTLEIARWQIPAFGNGQDVFTGRNTLEALLPNGLMVHGLGVMDHLSWNTPSWSISAELFAYALFGCMLFRFRQDAYILSGVIFFFCFLFFLTQSPKFMDVTYDYGALRCVYGFSAGMITYLVFSESALGEQRSDGSVASWSVAELAVVAAAVIFVADHNSTIVSILAPVIFGATVLVFAQQRGLVSTLMQSKPLLYLGAISYSIYMTHLTVQASIYAIARFGHNRFDWPELTKLEIRGSQDFVFGFHENLVLVVIMLAITILVSGVTYRNIEIPARKWFRNLASKQA